MGCTNETVSSLTRLFVPEYICHDGILDRWLLAPTNQEQIRTCYAPYAPGIRKLAGACHAVSMDWRLRAANKHEQSDTQNWGLMCFDLAGR